MSENPTSTTSRAGRAVTVAGLPFLLVVAAILLVAGSAITWVVSPNWGKANAVAPARNVGSVPSTAPVPHSGTKVLYYLAPNRIQIPKIGTDAPIVDMNELANRELNIPINPKIVGWWDGGAHPGAAQGSAVLAGHINYSGVTGEMARIGSLNPGDLVYVTGYLKGKVTKLSFKVTGVRTYRKTALPYAQIFDQKVAGRLVLVTCGGPFDSQTGNYLDNIVAYAVPTGAPTDQ